MHVHPKSSGHEAQGAHLISGTRKKPPNREEVGAVKDHFSEGRQQDNKRQPPKQKPNAGIATFELSPLASDESRAQMPGLNAFAAQQAAHAIQSLLNEAVPNSAGNETAAVAPVQPKPKDPSLDDLLNLMLTPR